MRPVDKRGTETRDGGVKSGEGRAKGKQVGGRSQVREDQGKKGTRQSGRVKRRQWTRERGRVRGARRSSIIELTVKFSLHLF